MELDLNLIDQSSLELKGKILRTPVEFSPELSKSLGAPAYLKLEFLQTTGSFKVRGALFYLSTLGIEEKKKGVAACSAGNHGLGVAYAAKKLGISCSVYVPKNVDLIKKKKILDLGATIMQSQFIGYDETLSWARDSIKKTGQHLITAFDDERIMAGNGGTLATEIFEEVPNVKNIIVPVGGGGLAAGLAYYAKTKKPQINLIASQHIQSSGLKQSLDRGKAVTYLSAIDTVACGLEGGLGVKCFEVLKDRIDHVSLLTENEIRQAFIWMLENHQYLIEPTAAVGIASCLSQKLPKLSGETVIILTGRNIAPKCIKEIITS